MFLASVFPVCLLFLIPFVPSLPAVPNVSAVPVCLLFSVCLLFPIYLLFSVWLQSANCSHCAVSWNVCCSLFLVQSVPAVPAVHRVSAVLSF